MTFLPGTPGSGIRFRRLDLEGHPEIEARFDSIGETNRSTTLAKGNVRIHTVEHVLAAFAGCGVDNAVVELDANEPPIGDGSALPYCRMIEQAGVQPQTEPREVYAVSAPLQVTVGESLLSVFPYECLKISCTSSDRNGRFTQFFSLEVSPETWLTQLAPARTFCFFEEIEFLIRNGLIKGGSLENAVVIRDDAVLTTEPLRFPEEFVRHKILDIVGDLSLLGCPLAGHIVALRPSHAANAELTRQLAAQRRKPLAAAQSFAPPSAPVAREAAKGQAPAPRAPGHLLDIDEVRKILPHRYPFLMVDRVVSIEGNHIRALKNVTANEGYFQGHFPDHPVMPGVLQLEAMAQVAGILMLRQAENYGKIAYFMSAERVKWRKPVRPGDSLIIDIEMTRYKGKVGRAKGICSVGEEVVSEAEVTFMLMDA
jgi:UDP-3-O-[3-hydroxymyristoyl] N-acetylglucosamine deacetylase/3-hydroxyacyl-[acyl-carrier-protein] dehydratase